MSFNNDDIWYQNFLTGETDPTLNPNYPGYISNHQNNILQLAQQNDTPEDALSMLKKLASEDDAYKELYIQLLAERENQERAYQWYEDFNNSYYQRTSKDLKAAGLNPWLALQSLGSAGSGSLTPAGTWSGSSGSSQKVKREEIKATQGAKVGTSILAAVAAIVGAIIMAMV